jgi:hypothetical protein
MTPMLSTSARANTIPDIFFTSFFLIMVQAVQFLCFSSA